MVSSQFLKIENFWNRRSVTGLKTVGGLGILCICSCANDNIFFPILQSQAIFRSEERFLIHNDKIIRITKLQKVWNFVRVFVQIDFFPFLIDDRQGIATHIRLIAREHRNDEDPAGEIPQSPKIWQLGSILDDLYDGV